tara:strand:- start:613 stop:786 length:174 start_codon:yes stop_codon:yes gene_type:complete
MKVVDKMKDYEIVRKSDGLYLFDGEYFQGPYNSIEDAQEDVSSEAQVQYNLPFDQEL